MQPNLRPAEAADLPFLFSLEEASFPGGRRESRRSLRRSLASPHQEVWVVGEANGSPAGALVLRFGGERCRIYSIAVDPPRRGRGLGRALLATAVARARLRHCRMMTLEVDPSDAGAVGLYRSMGFSETRVCPDFYGPGQSALQLTLTLSPEADASHQSTHR